MPGPSKKTKVSNCVPVSLETVQTIPQLTDGITVRPAPEIAENLKNAILSNAQKQEIALDLLRETNLKREQDKTRQRITDALYVATGIGLALGTGFLVYKYVLKEINTD